MRKWTWIWAWAALPLVLSGCTTFTITNLTPSSMPRTPEGSYPVEIEIASNQKALHWDSIKPYVVVGFDFYPMQPTLLMRNRWETLVPIPKDQNFVRYRFKVDYEYGRFGERGQGSDTSTEFKLNVTE